jgi:hypothetical protein
MPTTQHIKTLACHLRQHAYRDRSVFYTLLSKIVSLGLAPLAVLAVGTYLDPDQQGVYYVFGSLLQLRSLIDLGFSPSTQQLLANRFANLSFDRENGVAGGEFVRQGFLNLAKFAATIYFWLGLATTLLIGLAGDHFLARHLQAHPGLEWRGAWWVMICSVGLGNSSLGLLTIADGANQVSLTNKWRFWGELAALIIFMAVLFAGGGLWASASVAFVRLWIIVPVAVGLGRPFLRQIRSANGSSVNFRKTILPLQSKMMVVWAFSFVCYYSYNPFAMYALGPAFAGVIGMTMQIANMTGSLALVWYNTKLPRLGNLAGSGDFEAAMKLNTSGAFVSMALWFALAIAALSGVLVLRTYAPSFGARISPVGPMAIFLAGSAGFIWCHVRGSFVRAFCVEKFVPLALVQGTGTLLLLWLTLPGLSHYGPALTYLSTMGIGTIWIELGYRSFVRTHARH